MFTHRIYISIKNAFMELLFQKKQTLMSLNGCSDPGETFSTIKAAQPLPRVAD